MRSPSSAGIVAISCCPADRPPSSAWCPYHSWTYGLNGTLRAAAGFKNKAGFEATEWGLVELPVCEWHGLVFVDGWVGRDLFADALGTLEDLVAPYELERLVVRGQHDYEVAANWKRHREAPPVLPLPDDPSRAVPGEPAAQRESRRSRDLGGRLDRPAGRDGHHVAGWQQPGRAVAEARRARPAARSSLGSMAPKKDFGIALLRPIP